MQPELREEVHREPAFAFQHQGMAAGLREPLVRVPVEPAVIPPVTPEPSVNRGRAKLWGVVGVLAGGSMAMALALGSSRAEPAELVDTRVQDQSVQEARPVRAEPEPKVDAPPTTPQPTVSNFPASDGLYLASPHGMTAALPLPPEQPGTRDKISPRTEGGSSRPSRQPAAPRLSEVKLTRFSATGALMPADVRSAIVPTLDRLRRCHDDVLQSGQNIWGTIGATVAIRGGRVESIDLQTAIESLSLRACFRKVLVAATFPVTPGQEYTHAKLTFFLLARPRPQP